MGLVQMRVYILIKFTPKNRYFPFVDYKAKYSYTALFVLQ